MLSQLKKKTMATPTLKTKPKTKLNQKSKNFTIAFLGEKFQSHREMIDFFMAVEGACELGFNIMVMEGKNTKTTNFIKILLDKYPDQFHLCENNQFTEQKILDQSHIILTLSEPTTDQIKSWQKADLIPICPKNKQLENFNPQKETGQAFIYDKINLWHLMQAFIKAHENFNFSYDWKNLKKAFQNLSV